jgi:aryl-alcohol dehydrogenase-like predicted oxidoreductase/histidinol phosphatase-like enzyme
MWLASTSETVVAMGCMRLSTHADRDDEASIRVIHAALNAGVTLLDTAAAYCWDDTEAGHNERLIARALATWSGGRDRIVVATKGGLTRPQGRWAPDGRARSLRSACERSLIALGVPRIDLYQLHAPDPAVNLATSVRALAGLKRDGLIDAVGLCNVTVGQIEAARRVVDIDAVQVELSLWHDLNILNGVAAYCLANGIRLLAYRPLGGPERRRRIERDPLLAELGAKYGATPFEMALSWLYDFSRLVVPLPGPTHVETAHAAGRAHRIAMADQDRARLDERFPGGGILRRRGTTPLSPIATDSEREVVLIMGLPGSGKSTLAQEFVADGYYRLNRDETGGSLKGLLPALDRLLASGTSRVVLDNTHVARASRASTLETARRHGVPVRCIYLDTTIEDAQVNAVSRMLSRYGRLLPPEEMRILSKQDVTAFGPAVQYRYQRGFEPPHSTEGFAEIETRRFVRRVDPSQTVRALIVWCDDVLWRSRSGRRSPESADDVEIVPGRGEVLARYEGDGWRVLGLSWQPEIADASKAPSQVEASVARLQKLLGVSIEVKYCPHGAGPPVCWCRKPLPGLGVLFIHRHRLDPAQCIYIGDGPQDPGFARKLGFQYRQAAEFFSERVPGFQGSRVPRF